jgi:hypothetical protein
MPDDALKPGTAIEGRFRVTTKIGAGGFSVVYNASCLQGGGKKFAVKAEQMDISTPQLRHEYKVYREMKGILGFSAAHYYGEVKQHRVLVLDRLGESIERKLERCGGVFDLKTTLQIADQIIVRVCAMHEKSLVHRDIKPLNICIGLDNKTLYIIDFGLAKVYRDRQTFVHSSMKSTGLVVGTDRYMSMNTHLGLSQSRRDDFESIAYMLIYFLKGKLPWQGVKEENKREKRKRVHRIKEQTSIKSLCEGLPSEFATFLGAWWLVSGGFVLAVPVLTSLPPPIPPPPFLILHAEYSRGLSFERQPDGPYCRGLFRSLYRRLGYHEQPLSWCWDAPPVAAVPPSSSRSSHKQGKDARALPQPLAPKAATAAAAAATVKANGADSKRRRPTITTKTVYIDLCTPTDEGDDDDGAREENSYPQKRRKTAGRDAVAAAADDDDDDDVEILA